MSKWKCEICNAEFENYQAQGFNHKIYCPLCYFKELYQREWKKNKNLKSIMKEARKKLEYYNGGEALYYVPISEILEILDKVGK